MNSFPDVINVQNISNFPDLNYQRTVGLFRQEIYETILLRKDENEYIDLDVFRRKYCNNKQSVMTEIVNKIILELQDLGWKTKLSFGDGGLFIFSTENPPRSCWD